MHERAAEIHDHARSGDRLIPLISAIIAVLAALGTLFAHHKSIQALALKNEALRDSIRASDRYDYYQAKRSRISTYNALIDAGIARDAAAVAKLKKTVDHEERSSLAVLSDAQSLETKADAVQDHAQSELASFQTFEIATTLFEVAIVLASISALTRSPLLLWGGTGLSAIGAVLLVMAFIAGP
jgi:predicted RND superfamily exporter protein